jgi:hypothetical protein
MITVPGVGRVAATPDVVRVRVTASSQRPTAAEALAAAEATAAVVRGALERHGVTGAAAASGLFSLAAEQTWSEAGGPRITGYRCDHEIRVVLRDVPAVGRVLADVLAAGGDGVRVDGVEPGIEDDAELRVRARELAWADALDRATRLAALAGRELVRVAGIVEGSGHPSIDVPMAKTVLMGLPPGAGDVSVRPGDVDVVVALTVQWELS